MLQIAFILIQVLIVVAIGARLVFRPQTPNGRVWGVLVLIVMVPTTVWFTDQAVHMAVDTSSARTAADEAVKDLRSNDRFLGPSDDDIRSAVHKANPFVRIHGAGTDRYELTNVRGRGPVCLTLEGSSTHEEFHVYDSRC